MGCDVTRAGAQLSDPEQRSEPGDESDQGSRLIALIQTPQKQTELMIPSLHRTRTFQSSMTLEDADRSLIVETLEQAGWVVGGPHGAAAKLGPKRTTLLAKMRRWGISRPIHREETEVIGLAPAAIGREDAHL